MFKIIKTSTYKRMVLDYKKALFEIAILEFALQNEKAPKKQLDEKATKKLIKSLTAKKLPIKKSKNK